MAPFVKEYAEAWFIKVDSIYEHAEVMLPAEKCYNITQNLDLSILQMISDKV